MTQEEEDWREEETCVRLSVLSKRGEKTVARRASRLATPQFLQQTVLLKLDSWCTALTAAFA